MRAIIFTVLLAGVYAAVPEEVPALDGTVYMRRTPAGPYFVHGCGSSSVMTSSSMTRSSSSAIPSSSAIVNCIGGCLTAAPTNGAIGNCPAVLSIGASCTPTCSSGYTISGNHTCAAATGNVLQAATCTANAASSSASANSSASAAAAATGTETTVTQVYTFASLTVAAYTGKMKSNCECAYANTVGGATTPLWCTATTSAYNYISGVAITSSAAHRRSAKVTFVLKVKSSVKSTAQLQTLVASGSTAANFATALAAVNTASNYTAAPGAATVATATFTGGSSSASTLLPSMLSLVAAIFVAARQ